MLPTHIAFAVRHRSLETSCPSTLASSTRARRRPVRANPPVGSSICTRCRASPVRSPSFAAPGTAPVGNGRSIGSRPHVDGSAHWVNLSKQHVISLCARTQSGLGRLTSDPRPSPKTTSVARLQADVTFRPDQRSGDHPTLYRPLCQRFDDVKPWTISLITCDCRRLRRIDASRATREPRGAQPGQPPAITAGGGKGFTRRRRRIWYDGWRCVWCLVVVRRPTLRRQDGCAVASTKLRSIMSFLAHGVGRTHTPT